MFGAFVKPDYQALIQARQALVLEMSNGGAKIEKVQQNVPDDATAAEASSGLPLASSHFGVSSQETPVQMTQVLCVFYWFSVFKVIRSA